MNKTWKFAASILGISLGGPILIHAGSDAIPIAAEETITAEELRSLVSFLASDELDGRGTGTQANRVVVRYLAHQLESLGLQPVEGQNSLLQDFSLARSRLRAGNKLVVHSGNQEPPFVCRLREDFFPTPLSGSGKADAELVFAGYGISAPDLGYDDYAGIDASGKVVVVIAGEPDQDNPESPFEGLATSEYSREAYKLSEAQRQGAAGVLFFQPSRRGSLVKDYSARWPERLDEASFQLLSEVESIRIPAAYVSAGVIDSLFWQDLETIQKGIDDSLEPAGRDLPGRVKLETKVEHTATPSSNVLGLLRGSDPLLSREIVVVSAHLDHLGHEGELIYNGADDDASGTSAVIEIAEAFALAPVRPERSVLFAFWNAEEHGLLGSRYFTSEPTIPLSRIRAVLQLDMVGRNQEVSDSKDWRFRGLEQEAADENGDTLHVVGYSRSPDLKGIVESANHLIGLRLLYQFDNHPLNLIRRSDSWPFLARGVPAFLFTTGLHPDYHTPEDDSDRLNYVKLERVARLVYAAAWLAANSDEPIRIDQWGIRQ